MSESDRIAEGKPNCDQDDAWAQLRGSLKGIFAELGGGEAHLRAERNGFGMPERSGQD